jgi:alpha-amylase/alpha-mannosidase (GH57 family)
MKRFSFIVVALLSVLVACNPLSSLNAPTPTPLPITPVFFATDTPTPVPEPIYLNIIWQFHQPYYTSDAQTNLITRPWVRVYTTRDYYEMATWLSQYPQVHSSFNFSPVLLRQINELVNGARDQYWEEATKSAATLNDEDKRFILAHFFDGALPGFVQSQSRYKELLAKRGVISDSESIDSTLTFSEQDLRDLQVWYLLSGFTPSRLAQSPLHDIVSKGRDYSEDDKHTVMNVALDMLRQVNALYTQLQTNGQAEISVSPYAEPILPLLIDSETARESAPNATLPDPPFRSAQDAAEQLKRAAQSYQDTYGSAPGGLISRDGTVSASAAQSIVAAGYQWTVSGEGVLAKAINPTGFQRDDAGTVQNADTLYRPYTLAISEGQHLSIFFRDNALSGAISTTDSALTPTVAADHFIQRLIEIKAELKKENASGPHVVTLVLDGESALSEHADGGQAFLAALYQRLSESAERNEIQTITPSAYLAQFTDQRSLDTLPSGSWDEQPDAGFSAWIGTTESNAAWNNLTQARVFLDDYLTGAKTADHTSLQKAYDAMLLAEGADWLQWHGTDESAGNKNYSDNAFRNLLRQVYLSVGAPAPDDLQVPLLPSVVITGSQKQQGIITPTIDGVANDNEWDAAGAVKTSDANAAQEGNPVNAFYYAASGDTLYFRVDAQEDWSSLASSIDAAQAIRVGIYLAKPDTSASAAFTRLAGDGEVRSALGMSATHLLEWSLETDGSASAALYAADTSGGWEGTPLVMASGASVGKVLELSAPLKALGNLPANAELKMVVVVIRNGQVLGTFPANGLAQMPLLNSSVGASSSENAIASFDDPPNDDHGPGSYIYPSNAVFQPGMLDLQRVNVTQADQDLVFHLILSTTVDNAWNSPLGLSIQTFDIYIDKDPGKGSGERKLLEGRNAVLPQGDGWEYALWVEGWNQQVLVPDGKGNFNAQSGTQLKVEVDPTGSVTIRVPLAALGDGNPAQWGYAVAVLGEENNPSAGVRRVRDVSPSATEWSFGGAPDDTNHTRIIDALVPPGASPSQEEALSKYTHSQEKDVSQLNNNFYGTLPLITISQ